MSEPREGLPPCVKGVAVFDGRQSTWHDSGPCPKHYHQGHHICYGNIKGPQHRAQDDIHPALGVLRDNRGCIFTDDPDAAQAAFAKGAEWVRTGEGP